MGIPFLINSLHPTKVGKERFDKYLTWKNSTSLLNFSHKIGEENNSLVNMPLMGQARVLHSAYES